MAIYRVIKNPDYITTATYHLRDKRLKLAAKGLMSCLLADEGDRAWTITELSEMGPEGRDAITSALRQLEQAGYIRKRQTHDAAGRFADNELLICESPFTENPLTVEPFTEKPFTENPETVPPGLDLELNQGFSKSSERQDPENPEEEGVNKSPHKSPRKRRGEDWKPERFDAFWEFYRTHCRGESKQAARRAWNHLQPDDDLIARIGQALRQQLRTDEWQRGIGIPYASTYLNQRRWEESVGAVRRRAAPVEEAPDVTYWEEGMEL